MKSKDCSVGFECVPVEQDGKVSVTFVRDETETGRQRNRQRQRHSVLQQLWMDVSVRCHHAERYNESASKPGVAAVAGEAKKTKRYGAAVRSLVFETYGRLGGEGAKLLRDLVAKAAANGQCSPRAVGTKMEDPAGASFADLHKQTHTCERRDPESLSDLLLSLLCFWQSRACAVLFGGARSATLM